MARITPGIAHLVRLSTYSSIPRIFAVVTKNAIGWFAPSYTISWFSIAAFFTVALLTVITIRKLATAAYQRRQADSLGARFAPVVYGKLPGNVDVLRSLARNFEHGYPADGFRELAEEYGPAFSVPGLGKKTLFTVEPQHIKAILATDFNNFVKGDPFQRNMAPVLGVGVFNSDGDMWKFHRSMTRPFFSRDRIGHFELFDRHADSIMKMMKERLLSGYAIDFQDAMARFTLDSATEFLLGSCVESIAAGLPYPHTAAAAQDQTQRSNAANEFSDALAESLHVIAERERWGPMLWPLLEIFVDRAVAPMKVVDAHINPIVAEAIKRQRTQSKGSEKDDNMVVQDEDTVLDHLVRLTSDPMVIKDETINILMAGRDTTAGTLTYLFYLLATHPAVLEQLREEILSVVGSSRRPDYDDLRDMKYLRAVINETLRLYPVVPFNVRESINATTLPSADSLQKPIYVPARTRICYSVFMMHRRKDLWGPDAEEFDPARFLDERRDKYLGQSHFIFLPFNAGPRICLGQQFAYNEISFMTVRLLQNFCDIALEPSAQPADSHPPAAWAGAPGRKGAEQIYLKLSLSLYVKGGLWVKMKENDNSN